MANGKQLLRMTVIVLAIAGVLGFRMEAMGMLEKAADTKVRPDVIMIDTIAKLDKLEQSAVVFQHDAHTKALKDQGMSCESCHAKNDKDELVLTFKGQEDGMTAGQLKDVFHDGCLSCHVASGDKGFKTGPMAGECRSCHQAAPEVTGERAKAGMDDMLHFTHWDSKVIPADPGKQTNCGACHKKAGEEDAWRFNAEFAAQPENEAFHAKCVTCHQSQAEKKAERTGPVQCAGCHGEKETATRKVEQAKSLKAMGELPRLPRKQPDAVLIMAKAEPPAPEKATGMAPVAFNHKLHEANVGNCLTCHTKGVNAEMDKSFKALHDLTSDASCIGCHAATQEKPECAGCHALRPAAEALGDDSCAACHNAGVNADGSLKLLANAPKEMLAAEAAQAVAARKAEHALVPVDAIPEFVTIGSISEKYQPSKMPHRKIVMKLVEGVKGSPLAAAFHGAPEALCAGCHHNAPATLTPSKCASCHAKPFEAEGRPGLKAAYHGQCMTCHTEMKLEKPAATDCAACHEKKAN